ncbi:replication protein C, IncQ-type [Muricoccus nepalensis]|nr:replication protein C, IncQ-type [Roseomonas nepalensis]
MLSDQHPASGTDPSETTEKAGPAAVARPRARPISSYALLDRPLSGRGVFRIVDPRLRHKDQLESLVTALREGASISNLEGKATGTTSVVEMNGFRYFIEPTYALGVEELTTLLALSAIAKMNHRNGYKYEATRAASVRRLPQRRMQASLLKEISRDVLRSRLQAKGPAWQSGEYLEARGSIYALMTECGLSRGQKNYVRTLASLLRLSRVGYTNLGRSGSNSINLQSGENLIYFEYDGATNDFIVWLNARLTSALISSRLSLDAGVSVDLAEYRQLRDGARIIHCHLSEALRASSDPRKGPTRYSPEDLAEMLYGPAADVKPDTRARQRNRAITAALQLNVLKPAWEVLEVRDKVAGHREPVVVAVDLYHRDVRSPEAKGSPDR